MNAPRPHPVLGSTLVAFILLFLLPHPAHAFAVYTYYNVGTVSPNATQICGPLDFAGYSTAYTAEGSAVTTSGNASKMCATLKPGTTLSGNFSVSFIGLQAGQFFYGTAAGPNAYSQPKYNIAGVFYAPPCSSGKSANSVAYGSSDQLKVDNSLTNEYTDSESVSLTGSVTFEVDYVPITIAGGVTYGWSASTTTGTDVAVTTSTSENYTIDGCPGVDGVNHKYDIIWIWLDPVVPYYIPPAGSSATSITVFGIGSDARDPVTAETKAPEVVQLSVLQLQSLIAVLDAGETPTPANTGVEAGTLQELARTWDTTWATNSGGQPGPGLVAADYQDILNSDPFVANPSFNPASSSRYALVSGATVTYGASSTPTEYSYTGQATDAVSQTSGTDDQHYVSVEVSVTIGEANQLPLVGGDAKLDYVNKWLWDSKSQSTTTNTSTQTATFMIWTPSASYTGPGQLAVYWDTVYQTFVFYPI